MNKLYRAKRKTEKTWVEGFYYEIGAYGYILETSTLEELPFANVVIDKDTVCKCTGIPDLNDTLIYEKDIIRYADDIYVVEWDEEDACFCLTGEGLVESFSNISGSSCEVVGNVFDDLFYELEDVED